MKIYTKTGDKGTTGLYTGQRVPKDSLRVEAYGTVDEMDAALGVARSLCQSKEVAAAIYEMQKLLWSLMADLASVGEAPNRITSEQVSRIEQMIDAYDAKLPPLKQFAIAGDNRAAAAINLARTVTRRAERLVWSLAREESVNEQVLVLLNRLSDLCFILFRAEGESHASV